MNGDGIPEDVKRFLLDTIDSVAEWEGLLLLRADPAAEWTAAAMAGNLYIEESSTTAILARLCELEILEVRGGASALYRYQPKSPEMDAMIGRTAELYAKYLVPITQIIHSKPKTKIQKFANAFRIRKDE
ncbi:MAG: hypothetical protein J0L97_02655 [Alphaproteobacteria bacterium]|nr:hypothetical protein [Alphaproteobacteria bacterium]